MAHVTTSLAECPVCGVASTEQRASFEYLNKGPHTHPLFDGFELEACDHCQSAWANPVPSVEELAEYYRTTYTPARMGFVMKDHWPVWDSRPASLFLLARMVTSFRAGDYVVDLGPGNGASLSVAQVMLPKPALACIELNRRSIRYLRKHMPDLLICESPEHLLNTIGPGNLKLAISAHCLEHFRPYDLLAEIEVIYSALSVGGVFAIEVPLSPAEKTARVPRHTPHLIFFSEDGLSHLLTRAGFEVKITYGAVGRTRWGNKYVNETFSVPPSFGKLSQSYMDRLGALNSGDFIAADTSRGAPSGGVLKCVAIKPDRQVTRG